MYTIEYVELENSKPFEEFMESLSIKDRAYLYEKIVYFLELKNNNLPIEESLSKHLEDKIFELRASLRDNITRVFYFYIQDQKIIITHGFIKKTQKTPPKEIAKAKSLRDQYNKRSNNDKL
jgi:phage-related protein